MKIKTVGQHWAHIGLNPSPSHQSQSQSASLFAFCGLNYSGDIRGVLIAWQYSRWCGVTFDTAACKWPGSRQVLVPLPLPPTRRCPWRLSSRLRYSTETLHSCVTTRVPPVSQLWWSGTSGDSFKHSLGCNPRPNVRFCFLSPQFLVLPLLGQCRRRWDNSKPTLGQRLVC